MDIKNVLYATDFSANSQPALGIAESLASAHDAGLLIVHVDNETPGLVFGDVGYGFVPEVDEIAHQQYQRLLSVRPADEKIKVEHRFARGDAVAAIIRIAVREHADVIVLGTHGRTGVGRLLMGSVAEGVLRGAPCPVLTVKPSPGELESAEATDSSASLS